MTAYQTDKSGKPVQLIIAWVLAVLTLGYMLPWAIAATRGKSNSGAIGVLTFLLGWTVIGWVVALAMACGTHQAVSPVVVQQYAAAPGAIPAPQPQQPPAGWYPAPDGAGERYWNGSQWTDQHRTA